MKDFSKKRKDFCGNSVSLNFKKEIKYKISLY